MKFTTAFAAVTALAMGASAVPQAPGAKDQTQPTMLVGSLHSDNTCDSKNNLAKWIIKPGGVDRCASFDEIEGVDDYSVKSLKVDYINDDKCALWIYSDYGCHMNAHRVEVGKCEVADRWGWRSYAFYCLE